MALAGHFQQGFPDVKLFIFQGQQVQASDHDVAPDHGRVKVRAVQERSHSRQMFGLNKGYVAVTARIAAVMVTRQTPAVHCFGFGQGLYSGSAGRPDADPGDSAFLGQGFEQFPDRGS